MLSPGARYISCWSGPIINPLMLVEVFIITYPPLSSVFNNSTHICEPSPSNPLSGILTDSIFTIGSKSYWILIVNGSLTMIVVGLAVLVMSKLLPVIVHCMNPYSSAFFVVSSNNSVPLSIHCSLNVVIISAIKDGSIIFVILYCKM